MALFDQPSLDETRRIIIALGKALFPELNFDSRRSYHGRRATLIAGAATQLAFHIDSAQQDLHPLTARDGKPINDWGNAVRVVRKGATAARKSAAARIRGAAGATVTSGEQLVHDETGLLFQIDQNVTIPGIFGVDPPSFFDADIAGVDTGSQTRLEANSNVTFLNPPLGIEPIVVIQIDLDEDGFDEEAFGSYRARFLRTFSETPSGGNAEDFVTWARTLPFVASAYPYPNRNGRGTIDVVAFYAASGSSRSLTSDDRDAVKAYIQTQAPFQISGAGGGLRVLLTVPDEQRVEIRLTPNGVPAFDFDWSDAGPPEVAGWTLATRELQFDAALPASLRAGHRLTLDGTGQDGREFKIESISGSDTVILEKAPAVDPAVGTKIYSGGPLVTPVRDAIVAHLNGEAVYAGRGLTPIPESKTGISNPAAQSIIGLDILAEGIGSSNPAGLYGRWAGGIQLGTIFKLATYKAGVRNAVIVTPVADYEPLDDPFPTSDQIHYVVPGAIIVRKA